MIATGLTKLHIEQSHTDRKTLRRIQTSTETISWIVTVSDTLKRPLFFPISRVMREINVRKQKYNKLKKVQVCLLTGDVP